MSRFSRHQLIDGFDQERLLHARILVVGAGAIGNEVLKNLSLLGVGSVQVLDPDTIEESNLTRSVLFRPHDIGMAKAEVAAKACQQLFPAGHFTWSLEPFWRWASLQRLRDFDAVIAATDNFESRLQVNRLCRLAPVDFFNAGIDSRHVSIEAFPFRTDSGCACYECTLPESVYHQVRERHSCGGLRRVAALERKIPTTAITSSYAGAGLAAATLNTLFQHPGRPVGAFRHLIDTANPLAGAALRVERSSSCPTCAEGVPTRRYQGHPGLRDLPASWRRGLTSDLVLSNSIVLGTSCQRCGDRRDLLLAAEDCDERLLHCTRCKSQSMRAELRDQLSVDELRRLPNHAPLPVKYLTSSCSEEDLLIEINPP